MITGKDFNEIFRPQNFKNDARHIRAVIERAMPGFERNVFFGTAWNSDVDKPALIAITEIIVGYNEDQERNDCDEFIIPDSGENALADDLAREILDAIEDSKYGQAREVYGTWVVWTGNRYPIPQGEWWNEEVYDILYASMFGGTVPDGTEDRQESIDWAIEEVDWTEGQTVGDHWVTEEELREMLGEVFDEAQRREREEYE